MIFYLKGNEIFEELLQLCRVYQLPTPIIGLTQNGVNLKIMKS